MEESDLFWDSLSVLDGTITRADTRFVYVNWFSTVGDGTCSSRLCGGYICLSRFCDRRGRRQRRSTGGGRLFFRVRRVGTQVRLLLVDFIRCRIARRIIRRVIIWSLIFSNGNDIITTGPVSLSYLGSQSLEVWLGLLSSRCGQNYFGIHDDAVRRWVGFASRVAFLVQLLGYFQRWLPVLHRISYNNLNF